MYKLLLIITFLNLSASELILPIPLDNGADIRKAELGKKLFFDTILSEDKTVSCLSCHDVYNGGADNRKVSLGIKGLKGNIQSPTVLNARYNFVQFWNGRVDTLHAQADGPINNPAEHGMNSKKIEERLNNSSTYKDEFKSVYGVSYIKYELVLDAIVEFEMALTTPNSKFDKYLRGQTELSPDEKDGYIMFKEYGCITCHNGVNIGGNSFQKMGTFLEYNLGQDYPDRSKVTINKEHKNVFKVPTLRNIALTAPYFHDGSAKNLKEALTIMSKHNLGVTLQDSEIEKIILFLRTLNGEKPKILDDK